MTVENTVSNLVDSFTIIPRRSPRSSRRVMRTSVRAVSNLSMADIEQVHLMVLISRMLRHILSGCRGNKGEGEVRSLVASG